MGHVSIHVHVTLKHSCEVEHAVDGTLNTLCMLRCRFGVGVGVGWGMFHVKLNTLWMLR